jgi:hypothetical protein
MSQLPLLIKELIEWYIWKAKIKECNQEYHKKEYTGGIWFLITHKIDTIEEYEKIFGPIDWMPFVELPNIDD